MRAKIAPGRLKHTVRVALAFLRPTSLKTSGTAVAAVMAGLAWILYFGQAPTWFRLEELGAQGTATIVGEWSGPVDLPVVAIHMHLLPDGNVLAWGNPDTPPRGGGAKARVWDPTLAQPSFYGPVDPSTEIYCSGHSFLADGRLLLTGSHLSAFRGLKVTNIFDFSSRTWSPGPNMSQERWYPTNTTLSNGEVLVVGGSINGSQLNEIPEVWNGTGWRALTGARLGLPLYPFMHLAPNGKVFNSGPGGITRYLDTSGTGSWTFVDNTNFGDRRHYTATSVMYEPGKVMILGGCVRAISILDPGWPPQCDQPPTASAEAIDLNAAAPQWQLISSMNYPRQYMNATILPDGQVLVTGGNSSGDFAGLNADVLSAEMWDPKKEFDGDPLTPGWATMAAMQVPRVYHSTAVLLPDGRVLTAGGGGDGVHANYYNAEYYSPPYLFKGPRPSIRSAPTTVGYGETFPVGTQDASDIAEVTLVRLSSVTHEFNQTQQFIRLSLLNRSDPLSVQAPSDPNMAPPGHYMLFILNGAGVPSVAKIVQLTTPKNNAPAAMDDSATTSEDTPVSVNVLSNDTDVEGDSLSVVAAGRPGHGTAVLNADQTVTYSPAKNFNGPDSFTYTISDGSGGTSTATVSVQITAVNDPPVASPQSVKTTTGTPVAITLRAVDVDGDPLTYSVVTSPTHGTLSGTEPNLTYSPNAGFSGSDSFTFKATDGLLDGNAATVSLTVTASILNTGLQSPTANAPVTSNAGDKNGFQTNPTNAYADDGLFAVDINSGSSSSTSCTSSSKDKHLFSNYGFSVPAGSTITGIEVRLDAKVDSTSRSPKLCVQLSSDGGLTWTTAKATPTLKTSEATYIVGSATDTWGRSWMVGNLANASFRVRVIPVSSSTSRDFWLDWVAVRVTYQPSS